MCSATALDTVNETIGPVVTHVELYGTVALVVYKSFPDQYGTAHLQVEFFGEKFIGGPGRDLFFGEAGNDHIIFFQDLVQGSQEIFLAGEADAWMKIRSEINKGAFRLPSQSLHFED